MTWSKAAEWRSKVWIRSRVNRVVSLGIGCVVSAVGCSQAHAIGHAVGGAAMNPFVGGLINPDYSSPG